MFFAMKMQDSYEAEFELSKSWYFKELSNLLLFGVFPMKGRNSKAVVEVLIGLRVPMRTVT